MILQTELSLDIDKLSSSTLDYKTPRSNVTNEEKEGTEGAKGRQGKNGVNSGQGSDYGVHGQKGKLGQSGMLIGTISSQDHHFRSNH